MQFQQESIYFQLYSEIKPNRNLETWLHVYIYLDLSYFDVFNG